MNFKVDVSEDEIIQKYPSVLEVLIKDQTTKKNIIWATDNYRQLGSDYFEEEPINISLITGENGSVIMPRSQKNSASQLSRTREMAEVFTPSWMCNLQNNSIDEAWFKRKNVFNRQVETKSPICWEIITDRIIFPEGKTWKDYVKQKRLEISCGEAPYVTSRYDTVSGEFIKIEDRIGFLDRKLRLINENTNNSREWLRAAQIAYKSTYAYEWQGDNLLLARQSLLLTFIENYKYKFLKEPLINSIKCIANIISWNVWQMDGIKGVVPNSCHKTVQENINLFPEDEVRYHYCLGCVNNNIFRHNGTYCLIKDWTKKNIDTGRIGNTMKFIDLIRS